MRASASAAGKKEIAFLVPYILYYLFSCSLALLSFLLLYFGCRLRALFVLPISIYVQGLLSGKNEEKKVPDLGAIFGTAFSENEFIANVGGTESYFKPNIFFRLTAR